MRDVVVIRVWWLVAAFSPSSDRAAATIASASAPSPPAPATPDATDGDVRALPLLPGEAGFEDACLRRTGTGGGGSILTTYLHRHLQAVDYLVGGEEEGAPPPAAVRNVTGSDNSPTFLVWRCRDESQMGGIGDRVKNLGRLFAAAIATGRVLLLDFEDFSDVFVPARHSSSAFIGTSSSPVEWRFSELEAGLRDRAPVWWEFGSDDHLDLTDDVHVCALLVRILPCLVPRFNYISFCGCDLCMGGLAAASREPS
jgi:hypothetical protein